MAIIEFDDNLKKIYVQCDFTDKMKYIFQKYITKANKIQII